MDKWIEWIELNEWTNEWNIFHQGWNQEFKILFLFSIQFFSAKRETKENFFSHFHSFFQKPTIFIPTQKLTSPFFVQWCRSHSQRLSEENMSGGSPMCILCCNLDTYMVGRKGVGGRGLDMREWEGAWESKREREQVRESQRERKREWECVSASPSC